MLNKQLRKMKYLTLRLLRINDNAHSIAIGFTVGLIMNFIPTFGLGPLLSTLTPKLVKGNSVAGLIGGIAFIWAFPFFFYLNIVVGESVLPIKVERKIEIIIEGIEEGIKEPDDVVIASLKIGKTLIVGMFVNLIVFGIVLYSFIYYIIKKYRMNFLKFIRKKWKLGASKHG